MTLLKLAMGVFLSWMSAHGLVSPPRWCEVPRDPDYTTPHRAGGQSIPESGLRARKDLR